METDASEARPLLALYLHLDFTLAAELAMQIDREGPAEPVQAPQSMMSTPMDDAMQSSVLRFLEAMHRPLEAAVLGPNLLRELYFRVLTGAQGSSMREALAMRGQFGRIGKSLRLIHAGYAQDARRDATGRGSGHERAELPQSLQAVTQVSPMQYVKSTRLHQARLLMVRRDLTAEAARPCGRLYERVAVQSRVQAPVRFDAGRGNEAHAREFLDSRGVRRCGLRVVALKPTHATA
jgi:AraC-like DNA-binding protein